jgi:hypothetical protein
VGTDKELCQEKFKKVTNIVDIMGYTVVKLSYTNDLEMIWK